MPPKRFRTSTRQYQSVVSGAVSKEFRAYLMKKAAEEEISLSALVRRVLYQHFDYNIVTHRATSLPIVG